MLKTKKVLAVMITLTIIFSFLPTIIAHAAGATYYVANNGLDTNLGTSASPFKTVQKGINVAGAGDIVTVKAGIYNEAVTINNSGSSALGYITIRSEGWHTAKILGTSSSYNTFTLSGNFIKIDGFEIDSKDGHGISCESKGGYEYNIVNNYIHDTGGSAVQAANVDYVTIEHNEIANCAWSNQYQCSGISIYEPVASNTASGFHYTIRNNVIHGIRNDVSPQSDGNGIIIDDYWYTQNPGTKYTYGTLIENNLCYNNGSRGIHVYLSDNVTIRNNTCYGNGTTTSSGIWAGEIFTYGDNNKVSNNICYATRNLATLNNYSGSNNQFYNNLTYGGYITAGSATINSSTGNKIGVDPKLFNVSGNDFHLGSGSPAINSSSTIFGVPTNDLDYVNRDSSVDIGAYELVGGAITNYITNYGFEANVSQIPTGWTEWNNVAASYTYNQVNQAHGGANYLDHWASTAYEVSTYQTATVPNGTYTLKAWVKRAGTFTTAVMQAKEYGGSDISYTIPDNANWNQITISNIVVTTGKFNVTFYTKASPNAWINMDDVELTKN